ncbi:MAG: valine--tRNA ligase [Candidatus Micrarchaeia archaeon]|jgi:valyl-tRNA synthetase
MYDPSIEEKLVKTWEKEGLYKFERGSSKPLYVIDTPPPFTSGVLHMGHALSYSFLDFVARYKRMKGYNVLYPQGWDTMGFPTERAVEKKYGKGLKPEEFIAKCEELSTNNLNAMREQMLRLGFSMDRSLEYITMSREYKRKVQLSVLLMYEKGLVYKGTHAVYWCPYCGTAIAREETEDREEKAKLNYISFDIAGEKDKIIIATTRPELLHACVAIAVNPNDEKNKRYIGKRAIVPIFGREVEVIGDKDVEMEFGTGAEMICTFGDKDDLIMFHRHKLPEIKSINEEGKLINAGKYTGLSTEEARSAIISDLKAMGLLVKQEEISHTVKVHDRCEHRVELISSEQWFMKTKEFADKIKEQAEKIRWIPEFTKRYLLDWTDYIDWDWVISRQRKFDTPLPFWVCEKCGYIMPADKDKLPVDPRIENPPIDKCPKCGGKMVGESSTCDVWVDSSITPLAIAGWPDDNELFQKAFPANIRVQGTEIIRSWAFYTIYRIWALTGEVPFREILIHGLVLGPDNRKMSKSFGNVVSPEETIKAYSADSLRMWSALSGALGRDRPLIMKDVKYAHSFINKLFNSFDFIEKALEGYVPKEDEKQSEIDLWLISRLNTVIKNVEKAYEEFDFMAVANTVIDFYWHEVCDFYLENIKHIVYGNDESRKQAVRKALYETIDSVLRMLAPIIPFSTDYLYRKLKKKSVHLEPFPEADESKISLEAEENGRYINEVISAIRREKTKNKLALNYPLTSIVINLPEKYYKVIERNKKEIASICKIEDIELKNAKEVSVEIKY